MKRLRTEKIQDASSISESSEWQRAQDQIYEAIGAIVWPPDASDFRINPVKTGNGVVPIKHAFVETLNRYGWKMEVEFPGKLGRVDASLETAIGTFGVEWETGNVTSSYRSLNRLSLGLIHGTIVAGVLVLPSRALYRYLTDRIGNFQEVERFFELYSYLPLPNHLFHVIEVEHDSVDLSVPFIPKGTDGWALVQRPLVSDDQ
jgi:hypothetical protein